MFDVKYEVIDEIKFSKNGKVGTHIRLVESQRGKRVIQLWSNLSKQWNVMIRYDVEKQWALWKDTKERIESPKHVTKVAEKKPVKSRAKKAAKPAPEKKPRKSTKKG